MPGGGLTADPRHPAPGPVTAAKARRAAGGGAWSQGLPGRVADLCRTWDVQVRAPLAGGGTAAWVAEVRRADGSGAVLKLPVPDAGGALSTRTLLTAAGTGYVQVLEHDGDDLLLELLGPSLDRAGYPPLRQLRVLAGLLPVAWGAATPADHVDPVDPVDKAADLAAFLTDLLPGPTDPVAARALEFAHRGSTAFRPGAARVLHGDAAPVNALLRTTRAGNRAEGPEAVFVDPDGSSGDPAYDVGVTLRDSCAELLAAPEPASLLRGWCREVSGRTGQDAQAVWEWAFLERVTTGRYAQSLGAQEPALSFLASAERLLPLS